MPTRGSSSTESWLNMAVRDLGDAVQKLIPDEDDFARKVGARAQRSMQAALRQRASTRLALAGYTGASRMRYLSAFSITTLPDGIKFSVAGDPFVVMMEQGWAPPASGDWEDGLGQYDGTPHDMRPVMGVGTSGTRVIPMTTLGTLTSLKEKMVRYAQHGLGKPLGQVAAERTLRPRAHPSEQRSKALAEAGSHSNFVSPYHGGTPWAQDAVRLSNRMIKSLTHRMGEILRSGGTLPYSAEVSQYAHYSMFSEADRETLRFANAVSASGEYASDFTKQKIRQRRGTKNPEVAAAYEAGLNTLYQQHPDRYPNGPPRKFPQLTPAHPPRFPRAQLPVMHPHVGSPFTGMHQIHPDEGGAATTAQKLSEFSGKGVSAYRVFRTISSHDHMSSTREDGSERGGNEQAWYSKGLKPVGLLESDEFERDVQVLLAETFKETLRK